MNFHPVYNYIESKVIRTLLLIVVIILSKKTIAQEQENIRNPIPVEIMFGRDKVNYLAILDLDVSSKHKLGYFGVISALLPYENENASNEIVITNVLTYEFTNNLYATGGLQYHYAKGLIPVTGIQYFSANEKWLFLFNPSLDLSTNINFEGVGIVEYKPKLSKKLRLYTRLQGLLNYGFNADNLERSFLYFRKGLMFNKTSVGFGLNLDFYGIEQRREENFGIFINHLF